MTIMLLRIKETGENKQLKLDDYNQDIIDYLEECGAFMGNDFVEADDDYYNCDQEVFDYWKELIDIKNENDNNIKNIKDAILLDDCWDDIKQELFRDPASGGDILDINKQYQKNIREWLNY